MKAGNRARRGEENYVFIAKVGQGAKIYRMSLYNVYTGCLAYKAPNTSPYWTPKVPANIQFGLQRGQGTMLRPPSRHVPV